MLSPSGVVAGVFTLNTDNRLKMQSVLLREALPSLAKELEQLLKNESQLELVAQVPQLRIVDRCRCEDGFCAAFYTQPKPQGAYPAGHRTIAMAPTQGMIRVDVVADRIAFVEVLYRDEIRKSLLTLLP